MEQLQLAAAQFQQGHWKEAASICRSLLANGHALFDVFHLYGLSLLKMRQFDQAEEYLTRAVERQPENAQVRNSYGSALHAAGKLEAAEEQFTHSIKLHPQNWEAWQNLTNTLLQLERYTDAQALLDQAEKLFGNQIPVLRLRAKLWRQCGEYQRSMEALDAIISQNQEDFDAINDKGITLNLLGQFDLSVSYFENIIKCAPDYVIAYVNLGYAYYKLGDYRQSKRIFNKSLDLLGNTSNENITRQLQSNNEDRPTLIAKINFLLSSIELVQGNYQTGWRYYTNRPGILLSRRLIAIKLPADLKNKRVLLFNDQGLGDEFFFLRFCSVLKQRGAYVHYVATDMSYPLLEQHPDIDDVTTQTPEETFDYRLSVGDLPYALDIDALNKIPAPLSLTADDSIVNEIKNSMADTPEPVIGITWRAGEQNQKGGHGVESPDKQTSLEDFINLFKDFTGTLVIVQRNPLPSEIEQLQKTLKCTIVDQSMANNDLKKMTAILSLLDDYIGVSNTNMHLRGSLGQSARVTIPYPPEWRWLDKGDKSAWYPDFSLYRQTQHGDWTYAIEQLRTELSYLK